MIACCFCYLLCCFPLFWHGDFHLLIPDGRRSAKFGRIPVALTCGVSQGATGISGPLVAAWFQGLGVSRERFVASNTVIFLFTGSVQLLTLSATGQWSNQRFYGAALAAVLVIVVLPFGIRIGRSLDAARFDLAVSAVIVACTVSLVVRAFCL